MKIVLNEDEVRDIIQKHLMENRLKSSNALVTNEWTAVFDENGQEVEFERMEYVLEVEEKKPKEGAA